MCLNKEKKMHGEMAKVQELTDASVIRGAGNGENVGIEGKYFVQCFDKDGNLKWEDYIDNLVTTVGKNDILDKYLGAAAPAGIFMGLISSTSYSTIVAGDTMGSHAGWLEAGTANDPHYSQGTRPAPAFSAAAAGAKTTSAAVVFSITTTGTVKGCFITTVATKDGTTGTLLSAGLFTGGDKAVANGDTLNVSYTLTLT